MSHWPAAFAHRCICGVAGGCVQGLTYLQPGFWCHSASVYDNCRLQTADCRPQSADCKLKDTKNLPNKGDTIKNITSCESEKVKSSLGTRLIFLRKVTLAPFPRCCWLLFTDATLYWLIRHITNCVDSLFFFDYCELIMTSSNAH